MGLIKKSWGYITGILGAIVAFLVYYLTLKNKEVSSLKAKISLAETEKQADLIEVEIKEIKNQKKRNSKEIKEIDKVLEKLDDKRKEMKNNVRNATDKEILDYWNK